MTIWTELICSACRHIFFSRYYDRTTSTEEKAAVCCPMCGSYGVRDKNHPLFLVKEYEEEL